VHLAVGDRRGDRVARGAQPRVGGAQRRAARGREGRRESHRKALEDHRDGVELAHRRLVEVARAGGMAADGRAHGARRYARSLRDL
jgi:hypothetical protein